MIHGYLTVLSELSDGTEIRKKKLKGGNEIENQSQHCGSHRHLIPMPRPFPSVRLTNL